MAQSLRLACIVVHYAHRNKTLHLYLDLNGSKIHKIMIIVPKVCWHLGLVNLAKKNQKSLFFTKLWSFKQNETFITHSLTTIDRLVSTHREMIYAKNYAKNDKASNKLSTRTNFYVSFIILFTFTS